MASSSASSTASVPSGGTGDTASRSLRRAATTHVRALTPTPLTTALGGVEVGLVRGAAGLRLLVLLQAAVPVFFDTSAYTRPVLATVLYLGAVLLSVVVLYGVLTGSRRRRRWFARLDLVGAATVLAVTPATVGPNQLIGSWTAWAHPFALSAVVLAAVLLRRTEALLAGVAVAVVYVVTSQAGFVTRPRPWTAGVNAGGLVGAAVLAVLLGDFLRRLGAAADTTVRSAAQVAAEEERDRARLLLHDHGSLLAVLADRVDDAALRRQSRRAANEIAGFLAGPAGWDPIPEGTVADVVREAAAPFSDLPLTVTVELASRVELDPERADVLAGAVTTLLHNVRAHAHARSVVVHADVDDDDDGSSWEVTVRDDGVGFDPATTPRGFGLGRQVVAAATRVGLLVDVGSAPGEGTLVRLHTGPARSDGADHGDQDFHGTDGTDGGPR